MKIPLFPNKVGKRSGTNNRVTKKGKHKSVIQMPLLFRAPLQLNFVIFFRCHRFTTKRDCVNAMDPYCGWNKQKNECTMTPNKNPRAAYWQQNMLTCPVLSDPVRLNFLLHIPFENVHAWLLNG